MNVFHLEGDFLIRSLFELLKEPQLRQIRSRCMSLRTLTLDNGQQEVVRNTAFCQEF